MTGKTDEPYEESVKLHALAVETRNFEIGKLIERNNFFMLFQGVLLAGVLQSVDLSWKGLIVCAAGALVSLMQTMSAAGAKYWQAAWEVVTARTEKRVKARFSAIYKASCFIPTFSRTQAESKSDVSLSFTDTDLADSIVKRTILKKYSVSRAPIYVGVLFFFTWLSLALAAWFRISGVI